MDRSYYRSSTETSLIAEAKYNPNRELAIALGERLEDLLSIGDERVYEAQERASDFERDANKLDDEVYQLHVDLDAMAMTLQQRDDEIAHLRDQLNKLKKEDC